MFEGFACIYLHFNILAEQHFILLSFTLAILNFVHFSFVFVLLFSSFGFLSLIALLSLMCLWLDIEFDKLHTSNVYVLQLPV